MNFLEKIKNKLLDTLEEVKNKLNELDKTEPSEPDPPKPTKIPFHNLPHELQQLILLEKFMKNKKQFFFQNVQKGVRLRFSTQNGLFEGTKVGETIIMEDCGYLHFLNPYVPIEVIEN